MADPKVALRAVGPSGGVERWVAEMAGIGDQGAADARRVGILQAGVGQQRPNGRVIAVAVLGIGVELGGKNKSLG